MDILHSMAAGFSIPASKIDKLQQYANEKLEHVNFNEGFYEVDFIVNGNASYLTELIEVLDEGKKYFGQGNPEPIIVVKNIPMEKSNIQIIGANKDTMKFSFNDVTYIKFKASNIIEQLPAYKDRLTITVVGRSNINEWGGLCTPQILIDEIEIKNNSIYDF